MLEDRYYMRNEERFSRFSASVILIIVLIAVFAFQQIDKVYIPRLDFDEVFALSDKALRNGWIWQLFTFQFLHGGIVHLIFNCLGIWFFGRAVESRLGTANFLKVYFAAGLLGGL